MQAQQTEAVRQAYRQEQRRLLAFIRQRVADRTEAEDILQDVFVQFAESFSLVTPIEQIGAWLFRVARFRIIDRYRKKKPVAFSAFEHDEEEADSALPDFLLAAGDSPETDYARTELWEALAEALAELPAEQREVFVQHELENQSFKEMAAQTGVSINTLLSRKRYAVLHLRKRLQAVYGDFFSL